MFFESERGRARAMVTVVLLALTSCQAPRSVLLPEQAPFVAVTLRNNTAGTKAANANAAGAAVVEVAILPVSRSTGIPDASVGSMREAAYRELVSKGYSALNNQFVDERLTGVDLAAPGAEGDVDPVSLLPMGLLQSRIHADSVLSLRALRLDVEEGGRRRVSVRATLVAGASGEILFDHTRQRLARDADVTVDDLVGLVREVLTPLPAR